MKTKMKGAILLLIFFFICMGASFYISRYKLVVYPIEGSSMEPNVHHEDRALVYRTQKVKYNDIIILYSETYKKNLIKRVIGLGGDKIDIKYNEEIQGYEIWRNDVKLKEDFIKEKMVSPSYTEKQIIVPEGKIYFLGDNRNISKDSHTEDVMEDVSTIVGKVIMRYNGFDIDFLWMIGV